VGRTGFCALICAATATAGVAAAAVEPASWPPASGTVRAAPAESADRLYLLSFDNAALGTVVDEVVGGALGLPYEIDPTLRAKSLSFEVSERMNPAQLLGAFEATLAEQGVATTRVAGGLKLTARDSAPPTLSAAPAAGAPRTGEARPTTLRSAVLAAVLQGLAAACGVALVVLSLFYLAPTLRRSETGSGRDVRVSGADDPRRVAVTERLLGDVAPHPTALARARLIADRAGRPLEQVLNWTGLVSDQTLAEAYAETLGLPIWSPQEKPPLSSAGAARVVAGLQLRAALVGDDGDGLTVATDDPLDDEALGRLATATGRKVALEVARPGDLDRALGLASPEAAPEPAIVVQPAPPLALVDARASRAGALVFTRV
jgi:hypothetical protein